MGLEARCTGHFRGRSGEGRLQLETDTLHFRGAFRFDALLRGLKVEAKAGWLRISVEGALARFDLGEAARRWVERIQNPKGLIDKLGVKTNHTVAVVGLSDAVFRASLRERAGTVVEGAPRRALDALFLGVESRSTLGRIPTLLARISPAGSFWVVHPKGVRVVTELDVLRAGRAAGLVDVKVVRFSDTHTAHKFVRPKERREKAKA